MTFINIKAGEERTFAVEKTVIIGAQFLVWNNGDHEYITHINGALVEARENHK